MGHTLVQILPTVVDILQPYSFSPLLSLEQALLVLTRSPTFWTIFKAKTVVVFVLH